MLSAGNPFPNFSLPNQDGRTTKLSDFAGQWVVIYFYPKDDTPGCTIQGKYRLPRRRLISMLPG
jgi:thioredoxin-dependent peroxiredoxin